MKRSLKNLTALVTALVVNIATADDFSSYKKGALNKLKCEHGEYQALDNSASISEQSADKKRGSLKLEGGDDKYVDLVFSEKVQVNKVTSISFKLKRLSKQAPSKMLVSVKQGSEWRILMKSFKVPTDKFSKVLTFKLEGSDYRLIRFSSATPDEGGFLIDDLVITTEGDLTPEDGNPHPAADAKSVSKDFAISLKKDDVLTEAFMIATGTEHKHVINYSILVDGKIVATMKNDDLMLFKFTSPLKAGDHKITLQANLKETAPADFKLTAKMSSHTLKVAGKQFDFD